MFLLKIRLLLSQVLNRTENNHVGITIEFSNFCRFFISLTGIEQEIQVAFSFVNQISTKSVYTHLCVSSWKYNSTRNTISSSVSKIYFIF